MKILVCFKTGPDLDKVIDADWEAFGPGTDLSYAGRVINCFDESALEIALCLREIAPAEAECTALTLGKIPPPAVWQSLYAAGFDHVSVIEAEQPDFQPGWVAGELAAYAREGGFDLILTGRQAGLGDTATVPYLLAEKLGYPVVGEAETLRWAEGNISVEHRTDSGRERLTMRLPVVVAVGNSLAALRAVTLRSRLAAAKREVARLRPETAADNTEFPNLLYDVQQSDCSFLAGEGGEDLARQVAEKFLGGGERSWVPPLY